MKLPSIEATGHDPFLRMIRLEDSKGFYSKKNTNQGFRNKRRFQFSAELLKNYLNGNKTKIKIADVACGTGNVGLIFHEEGYDVTFVDNEPKFFEYINLKTEKGDIQTVKADCSSFESAEKFDAIFFGEAIEHMAEPSETLKNLRNNLKTGGMLCITTPNGEYVDCIDPSWNEVKDQTERNKKLANNIGAHVCEFTTSELKELILTSGFVINYHATILSKQIAKMSLGRRILPMPILNALDLSFSKKKNKNGKMFGQTQIILAQRVH